MLKTVDLTPPPRKSPLIDAKADQAIKTLLGQSASLTHPDALPARKYLANRGLTLTDYPSALRYCGAMPYHRNGSCTFPAIISGIQNHGMIVGLHCIYITEEGRKIAKQPAKKIHHVLYKRATSGGAIRLFEPGETLLIAEGIETSLAVHEMLQEPVWAATSAGTMGVMEIPVSVRRIIICADFDKSGAGTEAARKLGTRLHLQRREVHILTPESDISNPRKSIDWLDCLIAMKNHGI